MSIITAFTDAAAEFPCRTTSAPLYLDKLQTKQKSRSQRYYNLSTEQQKTAVALATSFYFVLQPIREVTIPSLLTSSDERHFSHPQMSAGNFNCSTIITSDHLLVPTLQYLLGSCQ